jgi:hypothetical protein
MKIRKTFVGNLPGNKIVNSNSTSETDTYSCKYLNERNVIVSSEEPTTGGEVWLQKSKNLFNIDSLKKGNWNGTVTTNRIVWGMKIKEGVTYTITNFSQKKVSIFETETLIQSTTGNNVLFEHGALTGTGNMTITTKNNTYLRLLFSNTDDSVLSLSDILPSDIQIEKGEVATPYEPYTPKKIHTKNDNGVYEEFYNEEEHNKVNYSGIEQRIGTYLGKPLYRQLFNGDIAGFSSGSTSMYKVIASNIEKVVNAFSTKTDANGDTFVGKDILLLANGDMRFQYLKTDGEFSKYYAMVEYTKTTD